MYPLLFGTISTYLVMWGVAAVVCLPVGTWLAARRGFAARPSALALIILAISVVVGSAHNWVGPDAATSLPVHPLQLYFLGAAVLSLAVLLLPRWQVPPGQQVLYSSPLFFRNDCGN